MSYEPITGQRANGPTDMNETLQFLLQWRLEILLAAVCVLLIAALSGLWVLLKRLPASGFADLKNHVDALAQRQTRLEEVFRSESARIREVAANEDRLARQELRAGLSESVEALMRRITENAGMQKDQLDSFARHLVEMTRLHADKFEAMQNRVDRQLQALRNENRTKLEEMRATVDEKLHATLERRLGESFRQVSDRLEQVYKGLGEMRSLAAGVGDLKRVLTNVKARGTWGEIRLGSVLEQILLPEQYAANVAVKPDSRDRVEFAVRLPGTGNGDGKAVWLPIDAKFPQEDYQRLEEAREAADREGAEKAVKDLEARIKSEARSIREKYIDPPSTTDFAILFLPVEGLYAEVLRRPGLCDLLQREYRVVLTGPTTLAALLNSLQMGFRTLAVEKRSSEVWQLLGKVKKEFGLFGTVLAQTKKKLQEASSSIDRAEVRSRVISRRLNKVQELPAASSPVPAEPKIGEPAAEENEC